MGYLFQIITLLGGLALFLFGMDVMGKALERSAGGKLQNILAKMSSTIFKGFLLGMAVTAVIQSSSATTVMVVGFVNSGIMTLKQAVGVIMGSNIGTTITANIAALGATKDAKRAVLTYKAIAHSERYTLLEINLETGRHHQIRCQLAAIGCPIKGDLKYGAKRSNPDGGISLHARKIEFVHPVSKQDIVITAPVPDDKLWRTLEEQI